MRRIALLVLPLALAGCGYKTWWNPPFTAGFNPNAPAGESENMRRVRGQVVSVEPLTPQAGDIWPGPLPPTPTLRELEQQSNMSAPLSGPAPQRPPMQAPAPTRGSSTPPGSAQPPLATQRPAPPASGPNAAAAAAPAREPGGRVLHTPSGPGVTSGGTSGYQTLTTPGGGNAIVVPNGNGTSTIIYSDGRIETVPTPK